MFEMSVFIGFTPLVFFLATYNPYSVTGTAITFLAIKHKWSRYRVLIKNEYLDSFVSWLVFNKDTNQREREKSVNNNLHFKVAKQQLHKETRKLKLPKLISLLCVNIVI